MMSWSDCEPGGVHFGTLLADGLRAEAGLGAETTLLGASLAAGGHLAGVEADEHIIHHN